jgi:large subunit ribosomal protein L23
MNQERMYQVLLAPHISEKSTVAAEVNRQHVFRVAADATRTEVKQAVEGIFNVKVENVRILNMKGKIKRFGGRPGKRSDIRKAYITLADGNDIDLSGAK